jgi:methyltransferase (TIGR00027 family)
VEPHRESRTALSAAYVRAFHYAHDTPRIFDDPVAHLMLTESEEEFFSARRVERLRWLDPTLAESCADRFAIDRCFMREAAAPAEMLSRARYAEDRLEEAVRQGVRQYVLVGAGMETFAFRRPDLNQHLQVFEIDRPAAQAFKRQRLAEAGLEPPANLHFVPVDFTQENVDTALVRSAHDPQMPTFFSWLGVTMYLDHDTSVATLHAMRRVATPGSHLVFDYFDPNAFDPDRASRPIQELFRSVRSVGEPMRMGFDPDTLETELSRIGFRLRENLSPQEIGARYFQGRTDGYHATEHAYFAWAVVE